jgi:hypothetical protein
MKKYSTLFVFIVLMLGIAALKHMGIKENNQPAFSSPAPTIPATRNSLSRIHI